MVTLWFNNVPAHLRVPFKAIKAFFDPSVKFGLQFNIIAEENTEALDDSNKVSDITANLKSSKETQNTSKTEDTKTEAGNNNIVSLDSFRKK